MQNSWWISGNFWAIFCYNSLNYGPILTNLTLFQHNFCRPRFSFLWNFLKNRNFKDFFQKNSLSLSWVSEWVMQIVSDTVTCEWWRMYILIYYQGGVCSRKKNTQPAQGDTPAPLPVPDCSALGPGSKPMPSTRCAHRGVTDMKVLTVAIARPLPSKGREESCNCNLPPMPATEWWATYTVTAGIWTGAQSICYLAGHPSYRRSDHWATSTAENFNVGNWIWILLR